MSLRLWMGLIGILVTRVSSALYLQIPDRETPWDVPRHVQQTVKNNFSWVYNAAHSKKNKYFEIPDEETLVRSSARYSGPPPQWADDLLDHTVYSRSHHGSTRKRASQRHSTLQPNVQLSGGAVNFFEIPRDQIEGLSESPPSFSPPPPAEQPKSTVSWYHTEDGTTAGRSSVENSDEVWTDTNASARQPYRATRPHPVFVPPPPPEAPPPDQPQIHFRKIPYRPRTEIKRHRFFGLSLPHARINEPPVLQLYESAPSTRSLPTSVTSRIPSSTGSSSVSAGTDAASKMKNAAVQTETTQSQNPARSGFSVRRALQSLGRRLRRPFTFFWRIIRYFRARPRGDPSPNATDAHRSASATLLRMEQHRLEGAPVQRGRTAVAQVSEESSESGSATVGSIRSVSESGTAESSTRTSGSSSSSSSDDESLQYAKVYSGFWYKTDRDESELALALLQGLVGGVYQQKATAPPSRNEEDVLEGVLPVDGEVAMIHPLERRKISVRRTKTLGQGGIGIVAELQDASSRKRFACKFFLVPTRKRRSKILGVIEKETHMLEVLPKPLNPGGLFISHRLLLPHFVVHFDKPEVTLPVNEEMHLINTGLGMPLMACDVGDVAAVLRNYSSPQANVARLSLVEQVLRVVAGFGELGFVHLDIKQQNFAMDLGGRVYLADFGSSKRVGELHDCYYMTPYYYPPEQALCIIHRLEASKKLRPPGSNPAPKYIQASLAQDAWLVGVLVFKLWCSGYPYGRSSETPLSHDLRFLVNATYDEATFFSTCSNQIPEKIKGILRGLLQINPNRRLRVFGALTQKPLTDEWNTVEYPGYSTE